MNNGFDVAKALFENLIREKDAEIEKWKNECAEYMTTAHNVSFDCEYLRAEVERLTNELAVEQAMVAFYKELEQVNKVTIERLRAEIELVNK